MRKVQKSRVALALFMLAVLLGGSVVISVAAAGIEFTVIIIAIIVGMVILLFVGSQFKRKK